MVSKISIIVAVYNVEKYLKRSLDSILNQSYKNIEVIIVNDGSTDNSRNICEKYAELYSNIKVIHKENGGLSSARNIGIENATGEYIGFVDSDDYISSNMFEEMYNRIIESDSDIAISSFNYVKEGKILPEDNSGDTCIFTKSEAINGFFNLTCPFNYSFMCNKLFKKELFKENKFNTSIISDQEDTEIMIKILNKCNKIVYIGEPFYYYVIRENSLSYGKLNSRKINTIDAFYEIYKYTCLNIQEYKSKALLKYISYIFNMIVEIIKEFDDYEDEYYKIINKINLIYPKSIFDLSIPIKYKFHSTFIIIFPNLYKKYILMKINL